MPNQKPVDSIWFNTNQGHFGLVLGEDLATGERTIYGGVCSGLDQRADELKILDGGNKVHIDTLLVMMSKITEKSGGELGKKANFLKWLLKPRGRKYSPFVTFKGGAMRAEVNFQIPLSELAEFFGVDEIVIDGKPYKKTKD